MKQVIQLDSQNIYIMNFNINMIENIFSKIKVDMLTIKDL